jgi:hypothetical protein
MTNRAVCTSWKRGDYTIDGCIHWLVGSGPNDVFYNLWNELIDMKSIRFVDHEEYIRVEDEDRNFISVYTDIDRPELELLGKDINSMEPMLCPNFGDGFRAFPFLTLNCS